MRFTEAMQHPMLKASSVSAFARIPSASPDNNWATFPVLASAQRDYTPRSCNEHTNQDKQLLSDAHI